MFTTIITITITITITTHRRRRSSRCGSSPPLDNLSGAFMKVLSNKQKGMAVIGGALLFNLLVIGTALVTFQHSPAALSVALLAYLFGLRHAVDADHIAAIDNAMRKLSNEGKSPFTAGMWFSLGHASVVLIACLIFALTTRPLQQMFPGVKEVGGMISTMISGAFLLLLAWANSRTLWQCFRQRQKLLRSDATPVPQESHHHGVLTRLCAPLFRMVSKSHHLFLIGFLFGIGFDTATEVAIFGMSANHAVGGEAILHIMLMPLLFTAGMMLIDTTDGVMMLKLYRWSQFDPLRSLNYTLAISSLSIVVAFAIGCYEVSTVLQLNTLISPALDGMMEAVISQMGWVLIVTSMGVWLLFLQRTKRHAR
ncbi:HoxN/HupN/NixA family nickel/cobalt transporter [Chimaeribacter coloradensis]|nr:HoxN/HupN/NixA family nickel/cobalt transporter [Chimaeribacter coloradensis]